MAYKPPTWHNNYDNLHLLVLDEDGTFQPNQDYMDFAEERNKDLEECGLAARLVWFDITSSFVLRLP